MFERLTDRARGVFATAKREAENVRYDDITVEQLMIALLDEDRGQASRLLTSAGVDVHSLRQYLVSCTPPAPNPSARTILERAAQEAREFGHNYIGTEHLLLAVTRAPGSAAQRVLSEHAFDHSKAVAMLAAAIEESRSRPEWRSFKARRSAALFLCFAAFVAWIAYQLWSAFG